ncbi:MAG: sulfotransferase [Emcibacteraceae bacterium]|nr:sulfotransferase [Emcibacteraceae bacterium]
MNYKDAIQRAAQLANQGQFAQADKVCRDIIAANDQFHPAYHLLGKLALHAGRDDIAIGMLHKATLIAANNANYQRDFGEVLCLNGKSNDAMMVLNRALSLNPNDAKSHYIAGMALSNLGMLDKSLKAYQTAVKITPEYGPAYNNMAVILENKNDLNAAKEAYNKAISINVKHPEPHNNLASILISEGSIKDAVKHLIAAIDARPDYIEAHHNLSTLKKYKLYDVHIEYLESILKNVDQLPTENKARLYFTLGKVYADLEDFDKSFDHYQIGNEVKRSSIEYKEDTAIGFAQSIKTIFDHKFMLKKIEKGNDDPTPIFIVGMPRSGSTLIEQILSGHSDVFAAGELFFLGDIIKDKKPNFPNGIDKISDDELRAIGDEYLERVKTLNPDAKHIVDKMPANYQYAGLIVKILPGAHIINARRNPMDCCLSIYTRLFLQTLHYSYDLEELGRYYARYQELMDHWHNVLEKNQLLDVHYENVVEDLEREARKLIDFIGLEWQDQILDFHNQKNRVTTASAAQVRKPIYTSSLDRWRVYEKHLGALKNILDK